jgi:hypothetical protein
MVLLIRNCIASKPHDGSLVSSMAREDALKSSNTNDTRVFAFSEAQALDHDIHCKRRHNESIIVATSNDDAKKHRSQVNATNAAINSTIPIPASSRDYLADYQPFVSVFGVKNITMQSLKALMISASLATFELNLYFDQLAKRDQKIDDIRNERSQVGVYLSI